MPGNCGYSKHTQVTVFCFGQLQLVITSIRWRSFHLWLPNEGMPIEIGQIWIQRKVLHSFEQLTVIRNHPSTELRVVDDVLREDESRNRICNATAKPKNKRKVWGRIADLKTKRVIGYLLDNAADTIHDQDRRIGRIKAYVKILTIFQHSK